MPAQTEAGARLELDAVGYGAMSLSDAYGAIDDASGLAVLRAAVDAGITHIDTANIYGDGRSETIIGRFIAERGRDAITLASKVGIIRGADGKRGIRGDREYIHQQVELSLARLGTEHLDLYYQHRVDPAIPIEETVGALAELVQAGKVLHIGLSEATGEELRRAHAVHPIAAVQSEWNLLSRDVETYVAPAAAELGVTFVAFSPLSRGLLTDGFDASVVGTDLRRTFPRFWPENLPANMALAREVTAVAEKRSGTTEEVALAWLRERARRIGVELSVIPGTRSIEHLLRNLRSQQLQLDDTDMDALDGVAARAAGSRSAEAAWVSGSREGLL
ncbi:aryl-alcohol dehydrogenase-like predicted oxidoreductase [Homoserinimonas aerilata]|uniref:Aryl-alcohol dehydrogenase-like predicted oxidoreductase n=1 Tax=Homoserinimonas aerilata TaxID=1162970 RepID=A0A542YHB2_9MICO|nr:aldo/keto reductase [Homoserinimonas aerilata]TQL47493.1 aryl-alcohol dehydrogenase-like predicted oxidoreductase [Homoserinimonas aerilata]